MSKLNCRMGERKGDEVEVEIEGRSINLPAHCFPLHLKENDQFQLYLYSSKDPAVVDKNLAKSLLEEILNGK